MNDSPRIVVLTTDFKPMNGGVAEYLHQLWNNVARDHPVTVMTTVEYAEDPWEHNYRIEQLPSLPQRHLGARFGDSFVPLRKLNTARYFAQLRQNARRTIDRIREQAPSCEAYVGIWDTAAHFWCEELYSAGIAYSLHAHGLDVVVPLYGRLPEWRRRDFHNAKAIYANSSATADLVRNKIGICTNIDVVHPGVGPMPDRSVTVLEAARLRSNLGLESKPVLLTLARLVRRKGVDLVLRCIPNLLPKYPDLHYLVAGEGPEKDGLQTLARALGIGGHVHFIGQTGEITKWALYEMCDVFVMPNRLLDGTDWEGFGIVFLEAALSGKPAIGGKNGGVPEAIEDGVTGLLVNPEDGNALSAAIELLLSNDRTRAKMGAHALLRARSQFEWSVVAGPLASRINESTLPSLAGRKGS
jgi:phosphatidylinositol alpha-1,6-mannosyltransferase